MQQYFWANRWKNHQTGFHRDEITQQLTRYPFTKDDVVLLPLCGKTIDLLWLSERVNKVVGVEFIPQAVNEFFSENKLNFTKTNSEYFEHYHHQNIEILQGDFLKLTPDLSSKFSVIFDRAALVALSPKTRTPYVKTILSLSADKIILITLDYPQLEVDGPPFSVSENEVKKLYGRQYDIELLAKTPITDGKWSKVSYAYETHYMLIHR